MSWASDLCPLAPRAAPHHAKERRHRLAPRKLAPPLRHCGDFDPPELGCVSPPPVQHHRKLAGERNRALHASPLCHPQRPTLQGGEPRCACEQDMRRLEQRLSHQSRRRAPEPRVHPAQPKHPAPLVQGRAQASERLQRSTHSAAKIVHEPKSELGFRDRRLEPLRVAPTGCSDGCKISTVCAP